MKLHKKFWLCLLAVVLLCALTLPEMAQAAGTSSISLSTDKDTLSRGDTVTVTVSTSAVDRCVSGGFLFQYDTDVFEYVSGKALVSGFTAAGVSTLNGKIAGYFMGGEKAVLGQLFQITLKVKDTAAFGSYTVSGTPSMMAWVEGVEASIPFQMENTTVTVACDHRGGSWTWLNDTQHKLVCPDCPYEELGNHQFDDGAVTQEPTCTDPGVRTYTCDGCQGSYTQEISSTGHDMQQTAAAESPACEKPGKTAVLTCANGCGHATGGTEIPALNHDMQQTEAEVPATCENPGKTAVLTCANGCGKTEGGSEITATGHTWDNGVITKQPTCKETGIKTYTCVSGCTKTEEVAKTNDHSFGQWFKADDSCNKRVCSVCQLEETSYIEYTVVFQDWNGTVLSTATYHWGDRVTAPADPKKAADDACTYTFNGWDQAVVNCAGDATYTATYSSTYIDYTVVFEDADGKVLSTKIYHWGDKVTAPANPTKTADHTYTYAFAGWDKNVVNCAGNATYTATYTAAYIDYTVTFKNWDGSVLSTQTYHYGDGVTAPADPTKAADETYTYAFAGWDKTVATCTGNVTYTATYTSTFIEYTVVFKNWDGSVISTKTYHYGNKVATPANPTKAADKTYTYAFAGWDADVVNCAGNATYTATYTSSHIDYAVVFKNWDGTVLSAQTYHYGDAVTAPADPTRAADERNTYAFAGWDKGVVNCAGNATYTATYAATLIDYTVVFKNWDGTVISTKTYHYGNKVTAPADPTKAADHTYTYTFAGWDAAVINCAGDATYTATFTPAYIEYTVTFQYADGTVIRQDKLHFGDAVVAPEAPAAPEAGETFAGWDKTVVNCEGNVTYTAVFEKHSIPKEDIPGDVDGNETVTQDDAVYLLLHTMYGEEYYPMDDAPADIDCNGTVDEDDVVYLLLHNMFGQAFYPLNTPTLPAKIEE